MATITAAAPGAAAPAPGPPPTAPAAPPPPPARCSSPRPPRSASPPAHRTAARFSLASLAKAPRQVRAHHELLDALGQRREPQSHRRQAHPVPIRQCLPRRDLLRVLRHRVENRRHGGAAEDSGKVDGDAELLADGHHLKRVLGDEIPPICEHTARQTTYLVRNCATIQRLFARRSRNLRKTETNFKLREER